MPRTKLTKRAADAATTADGFLWDEALRGFGLRITLNGRKSWLIQYKVEGRTKRFTLGTYPPVTPDQARDRAMKELARVRTGEGDPSQEKRDRRTAPTMDALAERYRTEHARKNKPATRAENERLLAREILPAFGSQRLRDITESDVSRWHAAYHERPILGNRALFLLSTLMNLAERWKERDPGTNPCRYVERFAEKQRDRHLNDLELRKLGRALAKAEKSDPLKVAAVRLLIFTGCRRSEILGLRWANVLLDRGLLLLPDSKTGSRPVLLNGPAIDVLRELEAKRREGVAWVFPNPRRTGPLGEFRKVWSKILDDAEIRDLHLHDLRHTHASQGLLEGLSLPAIGALLGHSRPQTTQRYAHWEQSSLRDQSERIGRRLDEALGNGDA